MNLSELDYDKLFPGNKEKRQKAEERSLTWRQQLTQIDEPANKKVSTEEYIESSQPDSQLTILQNNFDFLDYFASFILFVVIISIFTKYGRSIWKNIGKPGQFVGFVFSVFCLNFLLRELCDIYYHVHYHDQFLSYAEHIPKSKLKLWINKVSLLGIFFAICKHGRSIWKETSRLGKHVLSVFSILLLSFLLSEPFKDSQLFFNIYGYRLLKAQAELILWISIVSLLGIFFFKEHEKDILWFAGICAVISLLIGSSG